ncbi:TPA: flippase [Escherichia coli]|nr:flippase [Escherichia coli]
MVKILNKINNQLPRDIVPLIYNSMWLLFDKFSRLILGLVISTWVARYLGPQEYGILAYILAYLAFFQAVVNLGLDGIVVRDISRHISKSNTIIGTVLISRIIAGIILWLTAVLIIFLQYGFEGRYLIITVITGSILLFQSSDTFDLWFQSQSNSKYTVKAKLISYIAVSLFKILLLIYNASLIYFAWAVLIEALLSAICLSYVFIKSINFSLSFSSHLFKTFIRESWPFIVSNISIVMYMRIDQIFINKYLGSSQVGLYSAILPLVNLWSFIPVIISTSIAPYLAKLRNGSIEQYNKVLSSIFRGYALLAWIVCIPMCFASGYIVPLIFGSLYEQSSKALSILIFTNLFINMGLAQTLWVLNEGKSRISLYKTIFGAIVCVSLNIWLIPRFGINGAAITAVIAQFSSAILANAFLAPHILKLQLKSLFLIK